MIFVYFIFTIAAIWAMIIFRDRFKNIGCETFRAMFGYYIDIIMIDYYVNNDKLYFAHRETTSKTRGRLIMNLEFKDVKESD